MIDPLLMDNLEDALSRFSEKTIDSIISEQHETGYYASGRASASLRFETHENVAQIFGVAYFGEMAQGTPPQRIAPELYPDWAVFVRVIADWIADKGFDAPAYPIAKKIWTKGTQGWREVRETFPLDEVLQANTAELAANIGESVALAVKQKIDTTYHFSRT